MTSPPGSRPGSERAGSLRVAFVQKVQRVVSEDLLKNGLELSEQDRAIAIASGHRCSHSQPLGRTPSHSMGVGLLCAVLSSSAVLFPGIIGPPISPSTS